MACDEEFEQLALEDAGGCGLVGARGGGGGAAEDGLQGAIWWRLIVAGGAGGGTVAFFVDDGLETGFDVLLGGDEGSE